jgi:DNA-binding response OmpR family regulator
MSKILVVDDESSIRLLYSEELTDEGYQVATAATASEAAEKLLREEYDLMVLDIKLKNESGLDLLQKIVRDRHNLPVVLCTAFSCYKDDFSAWLADGYVVKSSNLQELKDEIRKILAKKAQRRDLTTE